MCVIKQRFNGCVKLCAVFMCFYYVLIYVLTYVLMWVLICGLTRVLTSMGMGAIFDVQSLDVTLSLNDAVIIFTSGPWQIQSMFRRFS
jgi:hypothetical protein